jgi:hypothetical protein
MRTPFATCISSCVLILLSLYCLSYFDLLLFITPLICSNLIKNKDKRTDNYLQNTAQKAKVRVTQTPQNRGWTHVSIAVNVKERDKLVCIIVFYRASSWRQVKSIVKRQNIINTAVKTRLWKLPKSSSKKQNIYNILLINMTQSCQIKQRYTFHLHPAFIE